MGSSYHRSACRNVRQPGFHPKIPLGGKDLRRSFVAVALAALLILSAEYSAEAGKRVTKRSLSSRLATVNREIFHVRVQLKKVKQQRQTKTSQLQATERRLESVQQDVTHNKLRLYHAQSTLEMVRERLERTRRQLERRNGLISRRLTDIYEGDDLTYLNVILGSTDVWTMLTRSYYVQKILTADVKLIEEIRRDEQQIKQDELEQSRRVREIANLQMRLVNQRDEVSDLAAERQNQLNRIEHNLALYEREYEKLLAQSRAIEETIRRLQNTPAGRQRYARKYTGTLGLPVAGRITSRFGYRFHPILRVTKLHTGIDIGARTGTPITAAGTGDVILAGWMEAYGYAIVIDHGGGVSTLYGHCSKLLVRTGQHIQKGQIIAKVGSTGWSTGPHCHFEKRINGKPVNPL